MHESVVVFLWLLLLLGGAGLLLWRQYHTHRRRVSILVLSLAVVAVALVIRFFCLEHQTYDYIDFLSRWAAFFRENGGFFALKHPVGNYNAPYLYFLALFSYLPVSDLFLIKLVSITCDLLLAWAALRLVSRLAGKQSLRPVLAFCLVMILPTVVLNGAYWGQCDSLYAALTLHALCCGLDERPIPSVLLLAVAFSFKLQTIFLIPLWCILWYSKRVRFRHLLLFPVGYLATILPALLFGKPLADILMVYLGQMGEYTTALTFNAPSIFALIPYGREVDTAFFAKLGILGAFLLILLLLAGLFFFRKRLTAHAIVTAGLIMAIGVPLLLPYMHDRYFYLADVLAVVWLLGMPHKWAVLQRIPVFLAVQIASLGAYHAYLRLQYAFPMAWGALLLVGALVWSVVILVGELHSPKPTPLPPDAV